ncbi:hypothetical protein GCM10027202_00080 [Microvirgula curvata]
MVGVTGLEFQLTIGTGTENSFGFVGDAPAIHAVDVEHWDALEFAARWYTKNAAFTGVAPGTDDVVVIELAGSDFGSAMGTGCGASGGRLCGVFAFRLFAGGKAHAQPRAGETGQSRFTQEGTATQVLG